MPSGSGETLLGGMYSSLFLLFLANKKMAITMMSSTLPTAAAAINVVVLCLLARLGYPTGITVMLNPFVSGGVEDDETLPDGEPPETGGSTRVDEGVS